MIIEIAAALTKEHYDIDFIMRIVSFIFSVLLGVGGKLAFRARTEVIKKREIILSVMIAFLVGYWVDQVVTHYGFIGLRGVFVSASALVSESVVKYWFANENSLIGDVWNVILRRKNGKH